MRRLNSKAKARAADALGIAQAHLRAAGALERAGQFDAALSRGYYAAFFGARAALADKTSRSKKHSFWIGEFNKRFGRGASWLPRVKSRILCKIV
jgi:uncharacterized protein (UPF0332 family)